MAKVIKIKKAHTYSFMPPDEHYFYINESDLSFVGGTEGVFATWKEGEIIRLAAGDDGNWWEIGAYHQRWIPDIITALKKQL